MVDEGPSQTSVDPELATAIDGWARGVFGAPRRLSASITAVEKRDEVIHRVLSDVVRRELREERAPTTERRTSPPRIALSQVDPFAGSPESLRADTLHTAVCGPCSASGLVPCPACSGRRVVACSNCGGVGKFRNPRTNRLNKCKPCKATGVVACGRCDESGRVSCQVCRGSGHQLAWLTYTETRTRRVGLHPSNAPAALAHHQLCEPRILGPQDVAALAVITDLCVDRPIPLEGLWPESRAVVQRELAALDPRLERVARQQYTCLAIVRRDVTYAMCGTSGTVKVSGKPLVADSTFSSTEPIRRRLVVWPLALLIMAIAGASVATSAAGESAYFAASNRVVWMLWLGATLLSIPWMGGLLRAWQPVLRFRGVRPLEVVTGIAWILMLLAIGLVGVVSRPDPREVEASLAAGDVGRARVVLDALVEREGESASILALEDAVLMAEADTAEGEERLAKLDAVTSHDGATATAASELARAERLAKIREHVGSGRADEAIDAIDRDFAATWRDDHEIAEERAKAEELRADRCSDDPCRLIARRAARQAHETPARAEAVTELHDHLLGALAIDADVAKLSPAERIRSSDEVASRARQVVASELDDDAIEAAATAATSWAVEERAAVPLLGADLDTLRAFFPDLRVSSTKLASVSLDGAELFFSLDAKAQCRGLYAVGSTGRRELNALFWSADRILSQAFGRAVKVVPRRRAGDTASIWTEGKTKIVARWSGSVPVELRIGDAAP